MSDLDFTHQVQQIPAGESLPNPIQRRVGAETSAIPNIQGAVSQYANSANWMSSLGSHVATQASNAIASRLGNELGQKPQGNIGIPLTEFDAVMTKSYEMQSQSTLGLQAQKLITQSNLELAAAPRISEAMIAKSEKQISLGLNKIFSLAPESIRLGLENHYGSVMINQSAQLANRMLTEQKQDRLDTLAVSNKLNNQNIHSLAMAGHDLDKNGDSIAALHILKLTHDAIDSSAATHDISRDEALTYKDATRQSYLSGKYSRLAIEAEKNKTLPAFMRSLADKPPSDIRDQDHQAVYNNVLSTIQEQQTLRSQDENYQSQIMQNRIATNPMSITEQDWNEYAGKVSPIRNEQMKFHLIQALKSKNQENIGVTSLIQNYNNPEAQANATPKIQNAAFYQNVATTLKRNPNLTQDQAEVQVAMSAGATVPVFTQTLKNKLWSGDPAQMDSAVMQIQELKNLHSGHALVGLNDQDLGLFSQYEALRNPADPTIGAKLAIENSQNFDPAVLKVVQTKWSNLIDTNTRFAKVDVDDWILNKFGFYTEDQYSVFHPFRKTFDSPFMSTVYAADVLNKYKSFFESTRGNETLATKMTQEYVDSNYGQTEINGSKQWTLHPIEKTIGFKGNDGIPVIHQDMARQFATPLAKLKEAYDNKASDEYWTIESGAKGKAFRLTKHERAQLGTKTKTYDAVLIGNNFDQWDVNIQTEYGPRNLFLESPMLGVMSYTPDRQWIINTYNGKPNG